MLLRPSPELNKVVLGILGRALDLFPVALHAFTVLSNHYHLLLTPPDAEVLSRFMAYLNRELSRRVGSLHDWAGGIWARRYEPTPVLDETSMVGRLRYVLSQGVKERLVEHALEWPGVSSTRSLLDGTIAEAHWVSGGEGRRESERDPSTVYPIKLAPLPCWAHLSPEQHRAACAALVAEIEKEAADERKRLGVGVAGADWVRAQHPHHVPPPMEHTPAPLVHTSSVEVRESFRAVRRHFIDAYRLAAAKVLRGERDVEFPPLAFPCPGRFVAGESWSVISVKGSSPPPGRGYG